MYSKSEPGLRSLPPKRNDYFKHAYGRMWQERAGTAEAQRVKNVTIRKVLKEGVSIP